MNVNKKLLSAIGIVVLCAFSFFSALKISTGIILGLIILCAGGLILCNDGKIRFNTVFKFWIIDIILTYASLYISNYDTPVYNYYVTVLLFFCICLFSSSTDSLGLFKILNFFSKATILIVIIEMIFRGLFFSLTSFLYADNKQSLEIYRVSHGEGFRGFSEYPNVISMAVIIILFYSVYFFKTIDRKNVIINFIISIAGLVIASERSNFILIPLTLCFTYFFYGNRGKVIRLLKVIAIAVTVFFIFILIRPLLEPINAFSRIYQTLDLFNAGENLSVGRSQMSDAAISQWKNDYLVGNGWFSFFYNNKGILAANDNYTHAHNFILEILCDCGLIGLLLVLIPILVSIKDNIISINKCQDSNLPFYKLTLSVQVFFVVDSLLHVTFYSLNMIGFYFIIITLYYIRRNNNDSSGK